MRFNINLPGPFSVSTSLGVGKAVRSGRRAAKHFAEVKKPSTGTARCSCPQPVRREHLTSENYRPQDRTLTDSSGSGGAVAMWLLGLTLVILAILGFGGFRL
jgi:hypothetical protein